MTVCKNCGEPLHWSLDFKRWIHDHPRVIYCAARDADNNPVTQAEPDDA